MRHSVVIMVCMYIRTYIRMYCGFCIYGIFHKILDDEQRSNCVCTVTDRSLTTVGTEYVPPDFNTAHFFSS